MNPLTTKPWLEPWDIANSVLWLVPEDAWPVTGIVLPVDMGMAIS
jgi:NAD(P)-dependent dehydrogenase (short-subunit alcohol dehydrogenase family)